MGGGRAGGRGRERDDGRQEGGGRQSRCPPTAGPPPVLLKPLGLFTSWLCQVPPLESSWPHRPTPLGICFSCLPRMDSAAAQTLHSSTACFPLQAGATASTEARGGIADELSPSPSTHCQNHLLGQHGHLGASQDGHREQQ